MMYNGNLGGVSGADAKCAAHFSGAKALLKTAGQWPVDVAT
eukprot:CAMPEP_0119303888 /NCGR_PEP_ID=MMETSP1333-20130426/5247_1 /TAXON_ID=418940 /ORGANISM="Scyphosphaera apsteinii, Strain RCC1455" /LENGTH=40 /DNA_ID= /DNA_START= /DNA_END= /DNA_ORIENTATION=